MGADFSSSSAASPGNGPAPTMRQIAAEAGVTVATVSMALRDSPRIRPETRQHVQAVAGRLGYRPNPLVSVLMNHVRATRPPEYHCTLAYIDHLPTKEALKRGPTYEAYYTGAIKRGEELGYKIEHFTLGKWGMSGPEMAKVLRNRGIQGVILAPTNLFQRHVRFDFTYLASASIGYSLWKPDLHRVCNHQYRTVLMAARELRRRGYRRVGAVVSEVDNRRSYYNWEAGFRVAASQYAGQMEFSFCPDSVVNGKGVGRWLEKVKADVVVSGATGILRNLVEDGWRVPEELGILDLDSINNRQLDFSGIDQNSAYVGETAVEMVVAQIQRNERGVPAYPKTVLVSGKWFEGTTLRPVGRATTRRRGTRKATTSRTG